MSWHAGGRVVTAQEAGQLSLPASLGSSGPRAQSGTHRAFFVALGFPLVESEMKEMMRC